MVIHLFQTDNLEGQGHGPVYCVIFFTHSFVFIHILLCRSFYITLTTVSNLIE